MKKPNKLVKAGLGALVLGTGCFALASCNLEKLFIYGGSTINQDDIESFDGTNNAIFFSLIITMVMRVNILQING